MTVILFTARVPDPLGIELTRQGFMVNEAIAISEVHALADQHHTATIIITADVDPERAGAIQHRYSTMHLNPVATVKDIVWELSSFVENSAKKPVLQ